MNTATHAELLAEFNHATASGWIPFFKASGAPLGLPVELLLGIASRETNMRNIKGDLRDGIFHGFGIMQVDIATDPAFCTAWTPAKVSESIQRGSEILREKRDSLAAKGITDFKALAAAYNAGAARIIIAVHNGIDPDSRTTGGNYGSDVVARMATFATFL